MTRILFIEQFSELGGGQRNLLDLLPAVMDRGWNATVAAPGVLADAGQGPARAVSPHGGSGGGIGFGEGGLLEKAHALGAETVRIGIGNYSAGHKTPAEAARFLLDTIALGRWISRQDFDLISAGGARLMPAVARGAVAVGESNKSPRAVVFQAQHFLGKAYAVAITARAIRRARATVIANSRYVASQYREAAEADKVHVVYNGVAEIPFDEQKRLADQTYPCDPSEKPWRIGLIGRIAAMKGQTDFLRAAALISRELPNAKFVICGAPMFTAGSYVAEVSRLAQGLPVEFPGWREDVGAVLADLDLLVAPSTAAEATTRVILEAFSAGVPVVAYAAGGIPEIVRDGDNGFLVPECEPGALARKVLEVVRMDLSGVARRARCDWERRFTIARYQREMTELMERVMSGG